VEILPRRREVLARYHEDGWRLLGLSWQPEIAAGTSTREQVDACFAALPGLLGLPIEVLYCPHGGGPPLCWCRKPLPGLGVVFIQRHRLDAPQCEYVGECAQDPGFARRLGFRYRDVHDFFGVGASR
jgi:histidinol phosphatase-like enzyme